MSPRRVPRLGWCPGVLRPMQTGDGLLVRVRPRAGCYAAVQLEAIARAAVTFGNGEIDLTNRANLQIRGVSPDAMAGLTAVLAAAGLVDTSAAAEAIRNVLVAPLAGVDPGSRDLRPLAAALEAAVTTNVHLRELPGKFGFAVDGGGKFGLPPGAADILLRVEHGDRVAVTLDGDDGVRAVVAADRAVAAGCRLAEAFLMLASGNADVRRMRDAVHAFGAACIFEQAGFAADPEKSGPGAKTLAGAEGGGDPAWREAQSGTAGSFSTIDTTAPPVGRIGPPDRPWAVGIGLPYGRITGVELAAIAELAAPRRIAEVRPSPWRVLVFPTPSAAAAEALLTAARDLDLIAAGDDPRLAMDVCPGAPACKRGSTSTRQDAGAVAEVLQRIAARPPSLHVSGCKKGCARRGSADLTIVARDGSYDIIRSGAIDAVPVAESIPPVQLPAMVVHVLSRRDA